jgi:seryl-tRNA synthetase
METKKLILEEDIAMVKRYEEIASTMKELEKEKKALSKDFKEKWSEFKRIIADDILLEISDRKTETPDRKKLKIKLGDLYEDFINITVYKVLVATRVES